MGISWTSQSHVAWQHIREDMRLACEFGVIDVFGHNCRCGERVCRCGHKKRPTHICPHFYLATSLWILIACALICLTIYGVDFGVCYCTTVCMILNFMRDCGKHLCGWVQIDAHSSDHRLGLTTECCMYICHESFQTRKKTLLSV